MEYKMDSRRHSEKKKKGDTGQDKGEGHTRHKRDGKKKGDP